MNDSLLIQRDKQRLDNIRQAVREAWREKRDVFFFTPHRSEHCAKVEEKLYQLLGDEKKVRETLDARELFLLLASVWLHDVGMIPELFPDDTRLVGDTEGTKDWDKHVRRTHGERSARYVKDNATELGLRPDEVDCLKKMCELHRYKAYGDLLKEGWQTESGIRIPLLTAYLRLADCLHISEVGGAGDFRTYMALGMDPVARFHWLKSKYAYSVSISPADFKITITVKRPRRRSANNDWEERMTPLKDALKRMVQDELDCVQAILARGGISIYLTVECGSTEVDMSQDEERELQELLKLITLSDPALTPNASEVTLAVLEQIRVFLNVDNPRTSANLLADYHTHVLNEVLKERPCHVFLWKVSDTLEKAKLRGDDPRAAIDGIRAKLGEWEQKRHHITEELPHQAYGILSDGGPFLVYGYSNSIVQCFEKLENEKKKRTEVYVCEARTKTQYRHNNRLTYSDAIHYMEKLHEAGITNLHYVTDSCASNLFSGRKVTKVLFGANGINLTGSVAHALGHLAIADMASIHKVPVYVIADSTKIGNLKAYNIQRGNQWLTTDREFESKLERADNYNPREDIVPADRIHEIITEKGSVPAPDVARYADNG